MYKNDTVVNKKKNERNMARNTFQLCATFEVAQRTINLGSVGITFGEDCHVTCLGLETQSLGLYLGLACLDVGLQTYLSLARQRLGHLFAWRTFVCFWQET